MRKVIVTGGAGFIGSHVVDALVARGDDVHVIDSLIAGKRDVVNPRATLHVVDIRECEALQPIMADADVVFHLAALPRVQYSIDEPARTHDVNVNGTLSVLRAAQKGNVGRVVFSSSSSVYGTQEVLPFDEVTNQPSPESPYALHKFFGEHYMHLFSQVYRVPTVSLRYFNVYGPRLDPDGPYALVIGRFLKLRKEGNPLTITGDGEQTRDFTHVTDVVRANLMAADSVHVGSGEVINIGAGHPTSVNALAELIGGPTQYVPARFEPKHTYASVARARELLGWEPTVKLEDGIAELKMLY